MAESEHQSQREVEEMESRTQTMVIEKEEAQESPPVLHLRLHKPETDHRVKWSSDVVDNEFMGKKKSKCCCIYEKPKVFGESSSSEEDSDGDDCTPNCRGHKKKCYRHDKHHHHHDHGHGSHDHHGHDGPQSNHVAG